MEIGSKNWRKEVHQLESTPNKVVAKERKGKQYNPSNYLDFSAAFIPSFQ
jgi:hypothetical protein